MKENNKLNEAGSKHPCAEACRYTQAREDGIRTVVWFLKKYGLNVVDAQGNKQVIFTDIGEIIEKEFLR